MSSTASMDLFQRLFTLISIFIVFFLISYFNPKRKKCTVPKAAGGWPIIGHLPLYAGRKPAHRVLGHMADKYGPIFATSLGSISLVIVSSHEIAKECFTVHDKVLDRPSILASKLLGYNDAMLTFSPYGPYWRQMRKIASTEILSNQRIDMQKHVRAAEVEMMLKEIYMTWAKKGRPENGIMVDMKQKFGDLTTNISLKMVAGKRYFGDCPDRDEDDVRKCREVIREFLDLFGVYTLSDVIPPLEWLDFHYKNVMKRTGVEMDKIVGGWLEEHKQVRASGGKDEGKKDFLDVLLNVLEGDQISSLDSDTILKAICVNFVLAGSETTIVSIIWALAMLVNNPHVLKKVQEELDTHIGKTRHVEESDINDLVYLQAVVKETIRLYPPVPLLSFRNVLEDFTISDGNYHVPAGTKLMLNAWKIQRDPSIWTDPDRFEPERFLTTHKDVNVGGQNFKLLPFGLGRRSCPAASLGLRMVHYLLARFLHSFEVAKPSNEDVDMTETNGLTNLKATPLEVLVTPRLDRKLYGTV